jgi:hypothetical protein
VVVAKSVTTCLTVSHVHPALLITVDNAQLQAPVSIVLQLSSYLHPFSAFAILQLGYI